MALSLAAMAASPFAAGSSESTSRSLLSSMLQPRRSSTSDGLPRGVAVDVGEPDPPDHPDTLFGSVAAALSPSNFDSKFFAAPSFGRHFVTQEPGTEGAGAVRFTASKASSASCAPVTSKQTNTCGLCKLANACLL